MRIVFSDNVTNYGHFQKNDVIPAANEGIPLDKTTQNNG